MSQSSYSSVSDFGEITELEQMLAEFEREQSLQNEEAGPSKQRRYIPREREVAEARLLADYFGEQPKYTKENFRRRYRMSRKLFLEIVQGIELFIETVENYNGG